MTRAADGSATTIGCSVVMAGELETAAARRASVCGEERFQRDAVRDQRCGAEVRFAVATAGVRAGCVRLQAVWGRVGNHSALEAAVERCHREWEGAECPRRAATSGLRQRRIGAGRRQRRAPCCAETNFLLVTRRGAAARWAGASERGTGKVGRVPPSCGSAKALADRATLASKASENQPYVFDVGRPDSVLNEVTSISL